MRSFLFHSPLGRFRSCLRRSKRWLSVVRLPPVKGAEHFAEQNSLRLPLTGCGRQTLENASGYQPEDGQRRAVFFPLLPAQNFTFQKPCKPRAAEQNRSRFRRGAGVLTVVKTRGGVWGTQVPTDIFSGGKTNTAPMCYACACACSRVYARALCADAHLWASPDQVQHADQFH